jgi:hypothetical protein
MANSRVMAPRVHLNGTSRAELERTYAAAVEALHAAAAALAQVAPNARDYYVIGPDAFVSAVTAHQVRTRVLRDVLADVSAIAASILNGGPGGWVDEYGEAS